MMFLFDKFLSFLLRTKEERESSKNNSNYNL